MKELHWPGIAIHYNWLSVIDKTNDCFTTMCFSNLENVSVKCVNQDDCDHEKLKMLLRSVLIKMTMWSWKFENVAVKCVNQDDYLIMRSYKGVIQLMSVSKILGLNSKLIHLLLCNKKQDLYMECSWTIIGCFAWHKGKLCNCTVREHSIDKKGFPPCKMTLSQLSLWEEMEGKQAY
jgi:hypothetical protein